MSSGRQETPIQAIVTDLGQVLLRFDQERCWVKILAACGHPEARQQFREVYARCRIGCRGSSTSRTTRCGRSSTLPGA